MHLHAALDERQRGSGKGCAVALDVGLEAIAASQKCDDKLFQQTCLLVVSVESALIPIKYLH
jgi:hypothetical protein